MQRFLISIIGILLFYASIKFLFKIKKLLRIGIDVEGTVIETIKSDNNNSFVSYPLIKFNTQKNENVISQYNIGTFLNFFKKNQKVRVIYNTQNPQDFFIKSPISFLFPTIALFISLFLIYLGINNSHLFA
jgi:hypothetical protein